MVLDLRSKEALGPIQEGDEARDTCAGNDGDRVRDSRAVADLSDSLVFFVTADASLKVASSSV